MDRATLHRYRPLLEARPRYEHASDGPVVRPPESRSVEAERRVVLYRSDGTPLVRPIGYRP